MLQDSINEYGCTVINTTSNKLLVNFFYSEERYTDFLNGLNCRQGQGVYNLNESLKFNIIEDNILIIVQKNGFETAKYKFITLFSATLEYTGENIKGKRSLTFRIRKNDFGDKLNFFDNTGNSLDFDNLQKIKDYLSDNYGNYKKVDWSVLDGQNDFT